MKSQDKSYTEGQTYLLTEAYMISILSLEYETKGREMKKNPFLQTAQI